MLQETFINQKSLIQYLTPWTKTLAAIISSTVIALSNNLSVLLPALGIALLLVSVAGLDFRQIGRRLLILSGFLLMIWLILPFTYEGEIVWRISFLNVSHEGLLAATRLTLKTCSMLLIFLALISTMSTADLAYALHNLKIPAKLVLLLLITYRYIFLIEDELRTLQRAAKVRNFKPDTTLHCYRTYAYLLGMLFVRAAERAQRVHQAMLCRGFSGRFHSLREYHNRSLDYGFLALVSIIALLMTLCEWKIITLPTPF
ncbi:MAG: cobalt ECF transporter T component CbiQ [Pseudomonadota bacterium]|nr:cobalt ECF transporter T component CbiQ [Pseudomonadota bacterium]